MQTLEAIEIEPSVREALEAYAEIANTPVNMLVREALSDYVECTIQSRLESMQTHSTNVHGNVVCISAAQ